MSRHRGPVYIENEEAYARAREANIKANATKGRSQRWLAEDATRAALVAWLAPLEFDKPGSFLAKMAIALGEWGSLTAGQESAVRKIMTDDAAKKAAWKARDAASAHVGAIGDRLEFNAVLNFVTSFESAFGYVHIAGLRDDSGNVLIVKGSRRFDAEKGDRVTFKATVKKHDVRDGTKQTIVNRPKISGRVAKPVPAAAQTA